MGWIIALIVGGVAGWLASMVMGRDASMGIFLNIVVGIIGSFIGNWVGSFLGFGGSIQTFSIMGLVTSFVGAVILLGILNLIQRGKVR
ncbi:MAG: GlsB/YeaQ/YmgE family stress response membrane protein [Pseudomonadota bacterium]